MTMEMNKDKATTFFKFNLPVHIITKKEEWLNGYMLEVNQTYLVVLDRVEKKGKPVFYTDIKEIEEFKGDYSTLVKEEVKQ